MCVKLSTVVLATYNPAMRWDSREKGVYLLLLEAQGPLRVGRLGVLCFDGWYVYVGSALGPGGLKRLQRHFDYADRRDAPMRWHVDALLGAGALRGAVVGVTDERMECLLAHALGVELIPAFTGFGSSDCGCATHLFCAVSYEHALEAGMRMVTSLGLEAGEATPLNAHKTSNSSDVRPA